MQVTWQAFRTWLKQERHRRGLSLAQMTEELGCSRAYLWRLEQGERRPSRVFLHLLREKYVQRHDALMLFSALESMVEYHCDDIDVEEVQPS